MFVSGGGGIVVLSFMKHIHAAKTINLNKNWNSKDPIRQI